MRKRIYQTISLFLLFTLGLNLSYAGGSEITALAKAAQNKTLIIVIEDIPKRKVREYKRRHVYEDMMAIHKEKSQEMLTLFQEHWTFNGDVVLMPEKVFKKMKKEKNDQYIYLQPDSYTVRDMSTGKLLVSIKGANHENVDPVYAMQTLQKMLTYLTEE